MRGKPREVRFSRSATCSRSSSRPILSLLRIRQGRPRPLRNQPVILHLHLQRKRNRATRSRAALAVSPRKRLLHPTASRRSNHRLLAVDTIRESQMGNGTLIQLRQCKNFNPPMASTPAESWTLRVCKSLASGRASPAFPRQRLHAAPQLQPRENRAVQLRPAEPHRQRPSRVLRLRRLSPQPPHQPPLAPRRAQDRTELPQHHPLQRPPTPKHRNANPSPLAREPLPIGPTERNNPLVETRCARCNAPMTCQPEGNCWCAELPPRLTQPQPGGCLCRSCLEHDLRSEREVPLRNCPAERLD
jgi:hypothetical protein